MGVDEVHLVGRDAASLEGHPHGPGGAGAGRDRLDHVPTVCGRAVPDDLPVTFAPRAFANSRSSRNSDPAPSPSTNPLRVRSNGRDTVSAGSPGRGMPIPRMFEKRA